MTNYNAEESYNSNFEEYTQSKQLPFRRFETATFLKLQRLIGLDDNSNSNENFSKTILDVACGDGFFTRMMPDSLNVVGVDIAKRMVEVARSKSPLNIKYLHYDGSKLNSFEFSELLEKTTGCKRVSFVHSAFFLHYSTTKEELIEYLESVYGVLEPGGVFFGINDNPNDDPSWYGKGEMKPIGYEKSMASKNDRVDGSEMLISFYQSNNELMQISNYYFTDSTYRNSFQIAGFEDFQWIDIESVDYSSESDEIKKAMDLYSRVQPVLGFMARKPKKALH